MRFRYSLLIIAILIKLCVSFLLLVANGYPETSIPEIACTGDCAVSYVPATANISEHGQFTIYSNRAPYSGRMPGYEMVLLLSTLFSGNDEISFLFVVIFQSIVAGISMYFLARLSYSMFSSKTIALLTYVLYGISTYVSLYDIKGLTESLATSVFIIAFSLLFDQTYTKSFLIKLVIGTLLLFAVLLRQYLLPFFILWALYIVYLEYTRSKSIKLVLAKTLIFLLPLFCFEAYWITRNYRQQNKFIPLVNSLYAGYDSPDAKGEAFYFPPKMKALASFIQSWGGDLIWWNQKAEITAFVSSPPKSELQQQEMLNSFPSYIYTRTYNQDSLIRIQKFFRGELTLDEAEVVQALHTYEKSFKEEKPVYYYLVAPSRLLFNFLFHSGTYNFFNERFDDLNVFKKGIKVFYTLLYGVILISGLAGLFVLLWNNPRSIENLMLLVTAVYIILLVSVVIRRIEYRHFVFAYPYFVMLASFSMIRLKHYLRFKRKRKRIRNVNE